MSSTQSRALDTRVAESVMGWVWMQRVNSNDAWLFPPDSRDEPVTMYGVLQNFVMRCGIVGPFEPYTNGTKHPDSHPPPYSADIAAAWLVVEALHARGVNLHVGVNWCDVWVGDGQTEGLIANSTPEAICKAALLAVGSARRRE